MVSWGSPTVSTPLTAAAHEALEQALAPSDALKVFPGTLVVVIANDAERVEIQNKLVDVAKTLGERVNILISPPMNGGPVYRGYIPSTLWPELSKRTASG